MFHDCARMIEFCFDSIMAFRLLPVERLHGSVDNMNHTELRQQHRTFAFRSDQDCFDACLNQRV